jgi:hypothetical protein
MWRNYTKATMLSDRSTNCGRTLSVESGKLLQKTWEVVVHIRSIIAAAAMSSISSLAVAQTSPAPTAQSVAGMKMANSAGMAVRFVTVKPADFTSSKLVGAKVYNN